MNQHPSKKPFAKQQRLLLDHLINNDGKPLNTYELIALGVNHPAQRIADLKAAGAIISIVRKKTVDPYGTVRYRVSYYRLEGWKL